MAEPGGVNNVPWLINCQTRFPALEEGRVPVTKYSEVILKEGLMETPWR